MLYYFVFFKVKICFNIWIVFNVVFLSKLLEVYYIWNVFLRELFWWICFINILFLLVEWMVNGYLFLFGLFIRIICWFCVNNFCIFLIVVFWFKVILILILWLFCIGICIYVVVIFKFWLLRIFFVLLIIFCFFFVYLFWRKIFICGNILL